MIFTSGDGGWSPFCADIAAHIAATGRTVVGFNIKEYLVTFASSQKPVTPDELTTDYEEIINASVARAGVNHSARATLAGWSIGAGYSVLMAVAPGLRDRVDQVIAISLPIYNELAWKPTDALIYFTHGTPHEKVFDTRKYLPELESTPISMINATNDDTAPYKEAQSLIACGERTKAVLHNSGRGTSLRRRRERVISLPGPGPANEFSLMHGPISVTFRILGRWASG